MDRLYTFLNNHRPIAEESVVWANGTLPLEVKSYLSDTMPPLEYVTSVRCILLNTTSVLVVRNPEGYHIVPGGRIEKGENLDEALQRELLEETGWSIEQTTYLGFMHYHPLKSDTFDFMQLIYTAQANTHTPEAKILDDYEIESRFIPISEIDTINIPDAQRQYLNAAFNQNLAK